MFVKCGFTARKGIKMTIRITCAQAKIWTNNADKMIQDAMSRAQKIPCDPLLRTNHKLSSVVSEIDGVKKRHGKLLSRAIVYAISKTPGWMAHRGNLSVIKGRSPLGCFAFNSTTGRLLIFDCRRGHGNFDKDTRKATDDRLKLINRYAKSYVKKRFGWSVKSKYTFILSLYGNTWPASYPIHSIKDISRIFAPCVGTFTKMYTTYVENKVTDYYASRILGTSAPTRRNIFLKIEKGSKLSNRDVIFTATGARIV